MLPLALFVFCVVWLATARPPRGAGADAPKEVEVATVEGWAGAKEGTEAVDYRVTLKPLHADPRRQSFESAALARRLSLDPGEPFRLELTAIGSDEGVAPIELEGLIVRDARGIALRPIPAAQRPEPGTVADPLAVLLAPPEVVRPGDELSLVLWGRRPEGSASLGGTLEIELTPTLFVTHPRDEALATLERPAIAGGEQN